MFYFDCVLQPTCTQLQVYNEAACALVKGMRACVRACVCVCVVCVHCVCVVCVHECIHVYACVCVRVCAHMCVHTCVHMCSVHVYISHV